MSNLLKLLGIVLLLAGLGHSAGVAYLYLKSGVPDTNRILIDLWVAEAQLLAGGLYFAAFRSRNGLAWRPLAGFGAVATIGFAVPALLVLHARAPAFFMVPPLAYLFASMFVLARLVGPGNPRSEWSG
jgi:peptidoglycan/LPS O-acetylase OafA/YrhL